ncbi:MAG: Pre (Mob) type recombination enzyme, partial [Flavobacteriaceae bacterium]|nr:Pre (Mob) type recombination enzyme [Flavobacteriaceae bacterium]
MAQRTEAYPVVLRMRGMYPRDLAAYERHRERVCGDNGHCDPKRKDDNRQLLGSNTWAQDTWDKIQDVRHANHERDLNQLRKRRRKKDLELAIFRGPRDPWRPTRHGPMREIILTVNKAWFDEDLIKFFNETGPTREELFEAHAKEWLINNFGDQCVHARADLDETTYHIHAVIVPLYASKGGR